MPLTPSGMQPHPVPPSSPQANATHVVRRAGDDHDVRLDRRSRGQRRAKAAPQFAEFTKQEKERLGIIKKQRCAVCRRIYELENLPGGVSYRTVEKLREKWGKEFGSSCSKDPRYAAPTKLKIEKPLRPPELTFETHEPDAQLVLEAPCPV